MKAARSVLIRWSATRAALEFTRFSERRSDLLLIALCVAVLQEVCRIQSLVQFANDSGCPLASSAHAMRAFFAAIATTAL
jgi:hypothetical protein